MPADLFLKLGNVKGESVDLKHAGEMELLSARWGMQVAVGANGGVLAPYASTCWLNKRRLSLRIGAGRWYFT